ncbi:hypothetical protein [Cupriavidus sp. CuC1]
MNHHTALIVTIAGMFICLVIGAYAQYRLLKKMADELNEED